MGSTSTHKAPGQSIHDFVAGLLGADCEIVASATRRNPDHVPGMEWPYHFYAAVRFSPGHARAGETWALVMLYSIASSSHWNITYKLLDETVGPTAAHAPRKVLDELTDTDSDYALGWRRACRDNLARRG